MKEPKGGYFVFGLGRSTSTGPARPGLYPWAWVVRPVETTARQEASLNFDATATLVPPPSL